MDIEILDVLDAITLANEYTMIEDIAEAYEEQLLELFS